MNYFVMIFCIFLPACLVFSVAGLLYSTRPKPLKGEPQEGLPYGWITVIAFVVIMVVIYRFGS